MECPGSRQRFRCLHRHSDRVELDPARCADRQRAQLRARLLQRNNPLLQSLSAVVLRSPGAVTYPSKDSDGSFTVSWPAVADATGYTLERAQDASFTSDRVILYNGSSTSCAETDLARGIYYYRVKAQNSCGGSIWQTGSSIKVKISILPPWLMLLLGS